jgi:hypothetical protein
VSSAAIGFGGATYSKVGGEPSIATIGGDTADSVVTSICGGAADSVAAVWQTRWRNPLVATTAH